MDEGFVSIWDGFQSFDSHHQKGGKVDDKSNSGAASLHVWYTPLKVHIRSAETVVPVYKDCTGAVDITLTDTQDRWVIDGYTLKVTSMNTGIFTVEAEEVITGADGSAAYTPQQAEAKAAQMAYIKEHGCLVIPDLTQLLLPHFGNWMKEGEKAGAGGDVSWMEVRGTLTMSKEK